MSDPAHATIQGGSFRDPSGFVFVHEGTLYRQVNRVFAPHYDLLRSSGLYDALVGEGLLIPHEEVDVRLAPAPDAYLVLAPEPVTFVSYPYEWCPGQLQEAALATLRIQDLALDHGMSLRDATAYNIQFHRGRPVLIDTLSFERLRDDQPWVAYRQFCAHFLAPLALACELDVRLLRLLRVDVAGVPIDLASGLLPARTRLRPGLLTHLHLHARSQRLAPPRTDARPKASRFSLQAFRGLIDSLRNAVAKLTWRPPRTAWSDYYDDAVHYSAVAMAAKERLVSGFLDVTAPRTVWDLGANTGRFSRLAAARAAHTVAFDVDEAAVEANWRQMREGGETCLLPLVMDLANPSPRLGWAGEERLSLTDRGPADVVFVLALLHHLAIGNNVPLERLAAFLAALGRWLVVEFVPKSDPRVRALLAVRDDVFPHYSVEGFEAAFGRHFAIERREALPDSDRLLYLLRSR